MPKSTVNARMPVIAIAAIAPGGRRGRSRPAAVVRLIAAPAGRRRVVRFR